MKNNYLLPLTVICFAALGCSSIRDLATKSRDGETNSNSGGSSKGAATASSDPRADIIAASKKVVELQAFSAEMESTGENEVRMRVDYVAPDRYRILHLGGPAVGTEIITIGKQSYMKTSGKWQKLSADIGSSIPTMRDSFTEEGLKTLTDVKFEGDEVVDGKPALVYSYKNSTPEGDYPFTSRIWIAKSSGLPMKITVDYEKGVLKQMNVVYDTETPIAIEPPVN